MRFSNFFFNHTVSNSIHLIIDHLTRCIDYLHNSICINNADSERASIVLSSSAIMINDVEGFEIKINSKSNVPCTNSDMQPNLTSEQISDISAATERIILMVEIKIGCHVKS